MSQPLGQHPSPSRPSTNISLTKTRGRGVKTKEPLFTGPCLLIQLNPNTVKVLYLQDRVQGSKAKKEIALPPTPAYSHAVFSMKTRNSSYLLEVTY